MPHLRELHSESQYLPATDCEVLPRAGFLLISSFFQESEEERWRDDTGICFLALGLRGPTALALAMISSD